MPVTGEIPATWKYETERFFVPDVTEASNAQTVRYFASYAAETPYAKRKTADIADSAPERATLNLSGFSFSFA